MKDLAEDGGGPAGVVEGFDIPKELGFVSYRVRASGVDGGLDENGTWKPDMMKLEP